MLIEKFDKSQYTAHELTMNYGKAYLRGWSMTAPYLAVIIVLNTILRGFPDFSNEGILYNSLILSLLSLGLFAIAVCVTFIITVIQISENKLKALKKASSSKLNYQIVYLTEIIKVSQYNAINLVLIIPAVAIFAAALVLGDFIVMCLGAYLIMGISPNAYLLSILIKESKGSYIEDSKSHIGGIIYRPLDFSSQEITDDD